jgi:hypothetical protein
MSPSRQALDGKRTLQTQRSVWPLASSSSSSILRFTSSTCAVLLLLPAARWIWNHLCRLRSCCLSAAMSQPPDEHKRHREERKEAVPPSGSPSLSPSLHPSLHPDEPPQCSVYFDPKQWSRRYAETFFTARIVSHSLSPESAAAVLYRILVESRDSSWQVEHRFSEFEQLLSAVLPLYSEQLHGQPSLPALPPKTWLPSRNENFVQERQEALQSFMQDLLQRKDICRLQPVRHFLQLDTPMQSAQEEEVGEEEGEEEQALQDHGQTAGS